MAIINRTVLIVSTGGLVLLILIALLLRLPWDSIAVLSVVFIEVRKLFLDYSLKVKKKKNAQNTRVISKVQVKRFRKQTIAEICLIGSDEYAHRGFHINKNSVLKCEVSSDGSAFPQAVDSLTIDFRCFTDSKPSISKVSIIVFDNT